MNARVRLWIGIVVILSCFLPAQALAQMWNADADFSITSNPNEAWRYGFSFYLTPGYAFIFYPGHQTFTEGTLAGLEVWQWGTLDPSITHNPLDTDIVADIGIIWPAHTCAFHPGPSGEDSIYRWTAPAAGDYRVSAVFWVGHQDYCSTDVHVFKNGSSAANSVQLFAGDIDATTYGNNDSESFNATLSLNAGDTLDFAVGYGSDSDYAGDTTMVSITIQPAGPCVVNHVADLNLDCYVNLEDFSLLADQWMICTNPANCGTLGTADLWEDLDLDCCVELTDFLAFAQTWLDCTDAESGNCGTANEILERKAMADAYLWASHKFGTNPTPPISFTLGSTSSATVLGRSTLNRTEEALDANRTKITLTYTDTITGLITTCEAIQYHDFPAVDWVVYFENAWAIDTPILSNVNAGDFLLPSRQLGNCTLHYAKGSSSAVTDFQPLQATLPANGSLSFQPHEGRSSDTMMPFFNLEKPDHTGAIVAVGWTGQWEAAFTRDAGQNVRVQTGLQDLYSRLHPGERIRVPSTLVMFWAGEDRLWSQNQFRRLILEHYSPKPGGSLVDPPVSISLTQTYAFEQTTEANMTSLINTIANNNLPVNTIWIDAGWYDLNGTTSWVNVGTWEPDPVRYPNGMTPVADAAHNRGFKFLLWFEPERVTSGSWLWNNHPEWIFMGGTGWKLLNLGHPDALAWVKNKFSNMISDISIDIYRQDFNVYPLSKWRDGELWDRKGMNEIRHIMGLYEFWDYLLAQHPNLIIDNCASGGRRIDIETIKRSVPLWRSDIFWDSDPEQAFNYGLSLWTPITGRGTDKLNDYDFRSGMGNFFTVAYNVNDPTIWSPAIHRINEYLSIRHLFIGDFWPLAPYSLDTDVWMAWQYDRPDLQQGLFQAFRRIDNTQGSQTFPLKNLDATATYTLTNLDLPFWPTTATGAQLMNTGISVTLSAQRAALITYTKN